MFSAPERRRDAGTLKRGREFNRKEADEFIVISFNGGTGMKVNYLN